MDKNPRINVSFVNGDRNGFQCTSVGGKVCRMYIVPRSELNHVNVNKEKVLQNPGLYILIGEEETSKPKAYIGQTRGILKRLKEHDRGKEFWQKALVFVSSDGLNVAEVEYLEYEALNAAKESDRFVLEGNFQNPNPPKGLNECDKENMNSFFEQIKLVAFLRGYNVFEPPILREEKRDSSANEKQKRAQFEGTLFYLKGQKGQKGQCDARGFYNPTSKEFTVLEGSVVAEFSTPSFKKKGKRDREVVEWTSKSTGIGRIVKSDKICDSPSAAAEFCTGRSSSGWEEWKDEQGRTLDKVYRKQG